MLPMPCHRVRDRSRSMVKRALEMRDRTLGVMSEGLITDQVELSDSCSFHD